MRTFVVHPKFEDIRPSRQQIDDLNAYLTWEIDDIVSGRLAIERAWSENLRQYEAIPRERFKNFPIENSPNLEIPLGAMAVDIFNSVALRQIFTIDPLVKASSAPGEGPEGQGRFVEEAKSIQQFAEWVIRNESMVRSAADHSFLDTIQLGTGAYYIPWIEEFKKTRSRTIITRRPVIRPWPIEDVFIPGGAYQGIQEQRLVGLRYYLDQWSLEEHIKQFRWDSSKIQPLGNIGFIRQQRERIARTTTQVRQGNMYELLDVYLKWDIDNDGWREDLLVTWDRTSRSIVKLRWNPYDHIPVEVMHYQKRPHLFYGVGILEKLRPLQQEATDIHNHRMLNMLLANTRFWKVKRGQVAQNFKLWPNRMMVVDDPNDVQGEQMGDIYRSSGEAEAQTMQLADRLVGINEMSSPSPNLASSRTPGVTSLALLQQANQRFAAAFDSIKDGTGGAIKQCLFRYQERLLMGDQQVEQHVLNILGRNSGRRVVAMMRSSDFDNGILIELTATGERGSRDAERQGLLQMAAIWTTYAERVIQLGTIVANPRVPPGVAELAQKIIKASGEIMERITITFDNIKDPRAFVIDAEASLERIQAESNQNNLSALAGLVQGIDQQNQRLLPEGQEVGP